MKQKKFELVGPPLLYRGFRVFRIRWIREIDFPGGFVESEQNLSHAGNCWITDDAVVVGNARVFGNAIVHENALIRDNARVYGRAHVRDDAEVGENARVHGEADIIQGARIRGYADVGGHTVVQHQAVVAGFTILRQGLIKGNPMRPYIRHAKPVALTECVQR